MVFNDAQEEIDGFSDSPANATLNNMVTLSYIPVHRSSGQKSYSNTHLQNIKISSCKHNINRQWIMLMSFLFIVYVTYDI